MTSYPGGLDAAPQTYTDFTGDPPSAPITAILDADAVNLIFSALVAIETALGLTPQGTVGTGSGAATVAARLTAIDQAIAAGGVADGSITTVKLAAASVTAAKLAAGAVGTAAIADGAVTAAKVAGDVATQAELDAVITALGGKADTSALSAYLTTAAASASYATFLNLARNPDLIITGAITRDSNGAATSATVTWPDGTTGTYTATTVSTAFPGAVDAYTVTYGSPVTRTYTQAAVTRDASTGAVTNAPAIAVS